MHRLILCCCLIITEAFSQDVSAQIFKSSGSANPLYWKNRKPDAAYWQQDVHYVINARLDETDHRIDGTQELLYTNNSPDTLHAVYFHLYQNAFVRGSYLHNLEIENGQHPRLGKHEAAGEGTVITFIDQISRTGDTGDKDSLGNYHSRLRTELDNTILKVYLERPLLPGGQARFALGFRTWYDNGSTRRRMKMYDAWGAKHYNGCQWFPKISVYDRKLGWDTYQHLNKEFYGDFGTFDVALNFPSSYVMEATGELTNRNEVLPDALRKKLDIKNFANKKWDEAPSIITPYVKGERKIWKYHAEGVHDFAFTADPSYRLGDTTWNGIQCVAIVQEPHAAGWQNAPGYVAKIIKTFSEDIGPYGYPKMVAADAADGMEYPMLTLDGGSDPGYRGLLVHEIGHNWFYGMVGSNETYRAALDEGFTQFLTAWGMRALEGDTVMLSHAKRGLLPRPAEHTMVIDQRVLNAYTIDALNKDELPLATHSNDFHDGLAHEGGYRQVYYKTASMLYNLQYVLGDSLFQKALQHYFMQWRFAHPYFEDFRASIIQFTHVDLNWFFDEWIETTKTIDYSIEGAKRSKGKEDQWAIKFRRLGQSQMPVDFTVTAKDGSRRSYTIPNTWFSKKTAGETLGKWWGWSKINPTYTAHVTVPGGLRYVQIDTSYRLADIDYLNNYYTHSFFGKSPGTITRLDVGQSRPTDRRHYRSWIRPDVWWNAIDGIKAGIHIEGDYLGLLQKINATVWWNTHLLQDPRYNRRGGERAYERYSPVSYTMNLSSPFTKRLPKLVGQLNVRDLDGLQYYRAGASYKLTSQSNISLHFLSMQRDKPADFDYLLYPSEWSSTDDRTNSSVNLSYARTYGYAKGGGIIQLLFRAPFLTGNGGDAFNYSFAQMQVINSHHIGRLDFRTRFFARFGMGTSLPYESLVFAAGANPEELMENKYTRSVGFVPDEWRGISRYEPTHFHHGGGMNLRGYSGYFNPDTRNGNQLVGYKGRSGMALNGELDFDGLIPLRPKATRSWLHMDAYLFADAGIIELSNYAPADFTRISPTEMWSDVHVDAGLGLAATIKRFGRFEQASPLTIRVDFPVFLNRPPFGNPNYAALRYVIGVERAF